jgi:nodulation protein E
VGVVSPLGNAFDCFSTALQEGRGAIGPVRNVSTDQLKISVAAEVEKDFFEQNFQANELSLLDRSTQFAMVAARQALTMSGLDFTDHEVGRRAAAIVGTGAGSAETVEENYRRLYRDNQRSAHPLTIPRVMANAPISHITAEHGIRGPSFMVTSACASSNHAIAVAFEMVRSGLVDYAVTGGVEACMTIGCIKGWDALRVMAPDMCRPFSRGRLGMVLGEGSGIFVLERWDKAQARDADIIAEFLGCGMSSDANHIIRPTVAGPVEAMEACLRNASIAPDEVDYINAHGTGTQANDAMETEAIRTLFNGHADKLRVSSTKSMHGHALGASGALEMVATLAAVRRQFSPPTMNYVEADPHCDLDCVPNEARDQQIRVALSNSFAFGGHNAVLAVGAPNRLH